jgi:2-keto-4-pentenoate hydratase
MSSAPQNRSPAAPGSSVAAAVERLIEATRTGVPCAPVRDLIGAGDIEVAYAVQTELIRRRVASGGRVIGRKIGLTSAAVQQQLDVHQPDFGVLLDDMDVSGYRDIPSNLLLQPRAEAEIAFVLGADLTDGPLDRAQIESAVLYAVAAIEIVDSRIARWDIRIADTVADNASSGLFVLGDRRLTLDEFTPREEEMKLFVDDILGCEGRGSACLGDPVDAVIWLARTAREYGDPLRANQVVLSGALGPIVPVAAGSVIRAELSSLGHVSAVFSPAPTHEEESR